MFQGWVEGVWSESFGEDVQYKVRLHRARPNSAVITSINSFAINLNLLRHGAQNRDGVVLVSEWIASVVVLVRSVHHNTSVPVVEDSTVLVHVVLSFTGAFSVVVLEVAPATVVPDLGQCCLDWAVDADNGSLSVGGAGVAEFGQHAVHLGDAGEGHWEGERCDN